MPLKKSATILERLIPPRPSTLATIYFVFSEASEYLGHDPAGIISYSLVRLNAIQSNTIIRHVQQCGTLQVSIAENYASTDHTAQF